MARIGAVALVGERIHNTRGFFRLGVVDDEITFPISYFIATLKRVPCSAW